MQVKAVQLVFGAMLAASAGGLATYETMMHVAMTCVVQTPAPQTATDADAMKRFMSEDPPPMTGGKRY